MFLSSNWVLDHRPSPFHVNSVVGGKNLSSQLQNATSKFSGKFQINVIKLIKLDDDMWHHIGISKFATCHLIG